MKKFCIFIVALLCLNFVQKVNACTISEDVLMSVPLNYRGLPNSYRIQMVDILSNARKWPDVEIQAQIIASAYIGEKNPQQLATSRGEEIKNFLIQLGIKTQYIYVDTHVISEPYLADSTGPGGYKQLRVSLMPLCKGGCERLCEDPRVTPTTKAIR